MNKQNPTQHRRLRMVLGLSLLLFLVAGSLPVEGKFEYKFNKPRLYFKVQGIGCNATGGFFKDFTDLNETYFNGLQEENSRYVIATDVPQNFIGYGAEIGLETERYSVGLSVEYIEKTFHLDYYYSEDDGYVNSYARDHTFSAVPIFFLLHYKVVETSFLTLNLTIGEGVYLGRYKDERFQEYENYDVSSVHSIIESNKASLGFQAGITIDLKLNRNLALSVAASYRSVHFRELDGSSLYEGVDDQGNTTISEAEGALNYWTNKRTGEIRFGLDDPPGSFWESIPAEFDLNGFYLSVGLKLTFGRVKKSDRKKVAPLD